MNDRIFSIMHGGFAQAERLNFVIGNKVRIYHYKREIDSDGSYFWARDYDSGIDGTTTELETARGIWKDRIEEGWVRIQ